MDWKNGKGEIIVMKLARLPLSAFMGVVPEGQARRALFHRADCYWLIDVDRFFFLPPRDASASVVFDCTRGVCEVLLLSLYRTMRVKIDVEKSVPRAFSFLLLSFAQTLDERNKNPK